MKTSVLLFLMLGVIDAIADPIPKQTEIDNKIQTLSDNTSDSKIDHEETALSEGDNEQNNVEENENIASLNPVIAKYGDADIDLGIEENFNIPLIDNEPTDSDFNIENFPDFSVPNDHFYRNAIGDKFKDEVMDTSSASFVAVPIFKKKKHHGTRRRWFASRRYLKRNPHRRLRVYYPYYGFYYPSSLRFY